MATASPPPTPHPAGVVAVVVVFGCVRLSLLSTFGCKVEAISTHSVSSARFTDLSITLFL